MSRITLAVLTLLLSLVPSAHAISRVGTCGIHDLFEGFNITEVPAGFRDIASIPESGVILRGVRSTITAPRRSPFQEIRLVPLRYEYPELIGLTRSQYQLVLMARGADWTIQPMVNSRLLVTSTVNGDLRTTIAAWGGGFGLVLHSEVNAASDAAVQQLLGALEVERRGLVW